MIDHQYIVWVALSIFFISVIGGIYLCAKCGLDDDMFLLITVISAVLAIVGGISLCPDNRTPTEKFNDKLSEYNMNIDNMVYIDEGKVFKFDNRYYLKTSNSNIVSLSTDDALAVYEK